MNIRLHANAITPPKIRQYIQASHQSAPQLADELGVNEDTIRRWRGRDGVADGSHTPHRLQTTLTPAQGQWWWSRARRSCCPWMTCWRCPTSSSTPEIFPLRFGPLSAPPRRV